MNHVGAFWVFGFMLSSDACIDASSKIVTEKNEKASKRGGGVEEKRVPKGAKLVQKNGHRETYDSNIVTLCKNENV